MKRTHPLGKVETSPQEGQPRPVPGLGHREEAGAWGYLFCDAILRRVDCHELRVFIVLFTAGRGTSIYHHLQRNTSLIGCVTAHRCHSPQTPFVMLITDTSCVFFAYQISQVSSFLFFFLVSSFLKGNSGQVCAASATVCFWRGERNAPRVPQAEAGRSTHRKPGERGPQRPPRPREA